VRIFLATKSVGGAAHSVGRGVVCVPDSVLDVIHIVRPTLTQGIKQIKSGIEDAKERFSLFESHVGSPDDSLATLRVECWQRF